MSDVSVDPGEPKREWITNPEHDFSKMNLLDIFLNPGGKTPITHFRRAWLFLVMLAVFTIILIQVLGGSISSSWGLPVLGTTIIALLLLTTLGTFSLHARRAADAGKSRAWALFMLLPALLAMPVAVMGGLGGIKTHYEAVADFRYRTNPDALKADDPAAFALGEKRAEEKKQKAEEAKKKLEEAKKEAEAKGEEWEEPKPRRGRGGRGGWRKPPEEVKPQVSFVYEKAVQAATPAWALPSFFVMLFSLIGFARWPSKD